MAKTNVIEFMLTAGDGGAETLVKDYALLMDKEQFAVTVVVLHDIEKSANLQRLKDNNISVIALSSHNDILKKIWRKVFWKREQDVLNSEDMKENPVLPGTMQEKQGLVRTCRHYLRNLYFGLKFMKIVKQVDADVVHAHLDVLYCLQTVSPLLKGIRLFHTCHALPELIYEKEEGSAAHYLIKENKLQLIALHNDMAKQMDEMFPEQKTIIIKNGINLDVFRNPGISRQDKRDELNIPQDAFLVGHVGRFTPEKNHPFLVEVFREIVARKENAFLLMVGAEDHSHIEKMLQNYGLQNKYQILSGRKDIHELLAAMDVFVFPSIFEGIPVSMVEAQAAGLRCLISDRCSMEVVCTPTCIPMAPEDPEQWAEAALDPKRTWETTNSISAYDMKQEIRRLEKLYLGQLEM